MIVEYAYAKINLALEVMNKIDGYHMVNNLMVPISIYDELSFEISDNVYVKNDNIEDNICVKAAKNFIEKYKINSGVCISINKRIPIAAGLAGGSSDAAATLRGLNRLFNINASDEELMELAKNLGSDVPFFINTKIALCTNRGEIINHLNINVPKVNLLLIKPNSGLSTKEVYIHYKWDGKSKKEKINNIINSLNNNDISTLKANIFNDLSKAALALNKELNSIYNSLKNITNIYISGSGPTMFIIEPTDELYNSLKKEYNGIFIEKVYTI